MGMMRRLLGLGALAALAGPPIAAAVMKRNAVEPTGSDEIRSAPTTRGAGSPAGRWSGGGRSTAGARRLDRPPRGDARADGATLGHDPCWRL
jgi:hypothetical protein